MAAEDQIEYIARSGGQTGNWGRGVTVQEALENCMVGVHRGIAKLNRVDGDWSISDVDGCLTAKNCEDIGSINLPRLLPLGDIFELVNKIMGDPELVDKIILFGDKDYHKYKSGVSEFEALIEGLYVLQGAHECPESYACGEEARDLYRRLTADLWNLNDRGLEFVLGPKKEPAEA